MWLLQRAVGYQQAAAACLLGTAWGARRAKDVGVVLDVVDDADALVDAAVELGSRLAGVDRKLVMRMNETFRESYSIPRHEDALHLEMEAQRWSTTLPSFTAGVNTIKNRITRG